MEEKKNVEKVVRIVSIVLAIFLIIILVIVKLNSPTFKLGTFFVIVIVVILFFAGVIFGYHFFVNRKKAVIGEVGASDEKLKAPITLEQCREIVRLQLQSPAYCDYVAGFIEEGNELLGKTTKSWVYSCKVRGVYEGEVYVIVFNRHSPETSFNLLINPKLDQINRAKMLAALHPTDEPLKEITVADNLLTGTTITTTKEIENKAEEDKKKKEDL